MILLSSLPFKVSSWELPSRFVKFLSVSLPSLTVSCSVVIDKSTLTPPEASLYETVSFPVFPSKTLSEALPIIVSS